MRQLQTTLLWRAGNCARFFRSTTILFLTLLLMACSKKDTPVTDNRTEKPSATLLTAGEWKLDAWTVRPVGSAESDDANESKIQAAQATCEKDDVTIFKPNGDMVMDPKTLCDNDPDVKLTTDKWTFTDDNAGIIIGTGAEATTYSIVELSANRLKMKEIYTEEGITYISEIVLVH
ncbi:lipocalin family protein [Niabella sp.]|uniref:lipocalin family protein n=1 Tax=Niabella sp. TaxID=1962976 RepID=UPI00260A93D3|nr:lipocalin family protein [Niabella sp.]